MKTELLRADHPIALRHAQDVLGHGGLVVFPTDTVYGMAAALFDLDSVERLYITKGRSKEGTVAVLISSKEELAKIVCEFPDWAQRLVDRFWPGPLTLFLPGRPELPKNLLMNGSVGVRMPDHPFSLALLRQVGPLAVTSANLSGKEFARTAQDALRQLHGRVHLVLDGGAVPGGMPSTVVDCTGEKFALVRKGPISEQDIQRVIETEEAG